MSMDSVFGSNTISASRRSSWRRTCSTLVSNGTSRSPYSVPSRSTNDSMTPVSASAESSVYGTTMGGSGDSFSFKAHPSGRIFADEPRGAGDRRGEAEHRPLEARIRRSDDARNVHQQYERSHHTREQRGGQPCLYSAHEREP